MILAAVAAGLVLSPLVGIGAVLARDVLCDRRRA